MSETDRILLGRLTVLWQSARWLLLAGLAGVAFLLGYVGFREYFDGIGVAKSTSDLLYLSLQLFVLESGSVPETGAPHTAHTLNKVPFLLVGAPSAVTDLEDGSLADIAPTVLALMGLPQPDAMTGHSLLRPAELGAAAE